jgi:Rieske Fe-S protein
MAAPSAAARMTRSAFVRGLASSVALAAGAGVIAEVARSRSAAPSLRTGRSVASLNGDGNSPVLSTPPPTAADPNHGAATGSDAAGAAPTSASLADIAGSIGGSQDGGASSASTSSHGHAKSKPTSTPSPSKPAPANGILLGNVSTVPANQAGFYTDPASGDPALLVHLPGDRFVAFDAVCTHAGCTVQYDPSQQLLVCPCHGAMFDPAQNARVVAGPADLPLTALKVKVLDNGDVYALPT